MWSQARFCTAFVMSCPRFPAIKTYVRQVTAIYLKKTKTKTESNFQCQLCQELYNELCYALASSLCVKCWPKCWCMEQTECFVHFLLWSWGILFSHPKDFTPVCTTELARAAKLSGEFKKRDVKMIALSIDSVEDHCNWSKVWEVHSHTHTHT